MVSQCRGAIRNCRYNCSFHQSSAEAARRVVCGYQVTEKGVLQCTQRPQVEIKAGFLISGERVGHETPAVCTMAVSTEGFSVKAAGGSGSCASHNTH